MRRLDAALDSYGKNARERKRRQPAHSKCRQRPTPRPHFLGLKLSSHEPRSESSRTVSCLALIAFAATGAKRAGLVGQTRRKPFASITNRVGAIIVGTKKSVYAVDGATGDVLWRRKDAAMDENEIAPVPGTDLVLLSFEKDKRTRIEATDILSGDAIWQSEKLKGTVMQMAVDIDGNLLAVVLARDAKGKASSGLKRKPMVHVLDLSTGDEIWKHELGSEIEMMPTRWSENEDVGFTLDNYHPPMFISGRLSCSTKARLVRARNGKERTREKYRVMKADWH